VIDMRRFTTSMHSRDHPRTARAAGRTIVEIEEPAPPLAPRDRAPDTLEIGPKRLPGRGRILPIAVVAVLAASGGYLVGHRGAGHGAASRAPSAAASLGPSPAPTTPHMRSAKWPPHRVDFGPVTVVAGTMTVGVGVGRVTCDAEGFTCYERGGTVVEQLSGNDIRVTGTIKNTWDSDGWGEGLRAGIDPSAYIAWGTSRLANSGGTWTASYVSYYDAKRGTKFVRWYRGSGGYVGLTFILWVAADPGGTPVTVVPWQGMIYPGSPPPH
jgi:hypothetical protein